MADYLSVDWTLGRAKAFIREQTGTLSQQESQIIDTQLTDLIHLSILSIRTLLDRIVEDFYKATQTITFGAASSGLCAGTPLTGTARPYDLKKVSLYDTTYKEIPIYNKRMFDAMRTVHTTASLTTLGAFAGIYSTAAGAVEIDAYVGNAAPAAATLTYIRPVTKQTGDTATLDLPDRWVPSMLDHCVIQVFRRLAKVPPEEVEKKVRDNVAYISSLLSVDMGDQ
jgi:hypothetical protein